MSDNKLVRGCVGGLVFACALVVTPLVSGAWTPTSPQISVAIFGGIVNDYGKSVAVDASGNIYTAGYFAGTADFDPGAGTYNLTSAGSDDAYVSKLNSSGDLVWAKTFGGTVADYGTSVAVDASGNIYTTGYFAGTADFDPGAGTYNLTSAGNDDVFVSKLNSSGDYVWAKTFGGAGGGGDYDRGNSVAVDASGNVYATGHFASTVDFDPGAGTYNLTSAGWSDVFVSKLNSSGGFEWAKKFGGTSWDDVASVAVDASGNIYTTGYFAETVDFDPGAGIINLTSAGGTDVFVSKLNSSGDYVWAKTFGGISSERGVSVAVDSSGNIYTTGYFAETGDFDPGVGTQGLTSSGSDDVFVSKLNSSGGFEWAKKFGGDGMDWGLSVAVDSSGNVYTTGYFGGTADFDPGVGTQDLISVSNFDVFVSKLNSLGGFEWAKKFGGFDYDTGRSVTVDTSGNVYATGNFGSTVDFDPGVGIQNFISAGGYDVFVSKLSPLGVSLVTTTTSTTTVPTTTTTTTTTTVPTTTTTTVPKIKILVVTTKKSVTAKAVAAYAQLTIKPKSVVSLKAARASSTFCKVFGATLKGLKPGSCKVTVTVKPAKGKSTSKTITLKISK